MPALGPRLPAAAQLSSVPLPCAPHMGLCMPRRENDLIALSSPCGAVPVCSAGYPVCVRHQCALIVCITTIGGKLAHRWLTDWLIANYTHSSAHSLCTQCLCAVQSHSACVRHQCVLLPHPSTSPRCAASLCGNCQRDGQWCCLSVAIVSCLAIMCRKALFNFFNIVDALLTLCTALCAGVARHLLNLQRRGGRQAAGPGCPGGPRPTGAQPDASTCPH